MAFAKFQENRFRIDGEMTENHAILVNLTASIIVYLKIKIRKTLTDSVTLHRQSHSHSMSAQAGDQVTGSEVYRLGRPTSHKNTNRFRYIFKWYQWKELDQLMKGRKCLSSFSVHRLLFWILLIRPTAHNTRYCDFNFFNWRIFFHLIS